MIELNLNENQSKIFFDVIDSEYKCVINEYDPDTNKRPSKKRLEQDAFARSIMQKWEGTQAFIEGTNFINLESIKPCKITLSDEEVTYASALLKKAVIEFEKELKNYEEPFTGILAKFKEIIIYSKEILKQMER